MEYKCIALTNKNVRCKIKVSANGKICHRHSKLINQGKNIKTINDINNQQKIQNNENDHRDNTSIISKNDTFECQCCYDEYDNKEKIMCNKVSTKYNHIFCRYCVKEHIINIFNEKKQIKCMLCTNNENCMYKESDIIRALTDDTNDNTTDNINNNKLLEKYYEHLAVDQATSLAKCLTNYHICPFCNKFGIIIDNFPGDHMQNIKNISCQNPNCCAVWCIDCRKGYHGSDPCNKIYVSNSDIIRKTIDETIDDAIIHKCPKCYTKYNKEDGCNLMTCPSCHSYSCYLCNILIEPINGLKYYHFNNQSDCPLYNTTLSNNVAITKGNIDYNNKKVILALNNLIEINKNNTDVIQAIRKEIKNRGYILK